MPKVSKQTVEAQDIGVGVVHETVIDGYEIGFMTMRQDADLAPTLKEVPGGLCTSHHWGYIISGKVTFTFPDHTEVFEAGDAFFVKPGHTPELKAGTEWLLISPEEEIRPVNEALQRITAAMQHA